MLLSYPYEEYLVDDYTTETPNYRYVGGASMATPHVSRVAALILQKDLTLRQADVEALLKETVTPLPTAMLGNLFAYNKIRWASGHIYAFLWAAVQLVQA